MENTLFIIMLIIFIFIDAYKMIRGKINFYSFYRPLALVVIYKFILENIRIEVFYIALFYMLISYFFILKYLNERKGKYE